MPFQSEPGTIRWNLHFNSPRQAVFDALATDEGRAKFWAEAAPEEDGIITFHIINYEPYKSRILQRQESSLFKLEYFGSVVEFLLSDDGADGTDLALTATQVDEAWRMEMTAGWVSVLMSMKAAVDHQIDLRNHDAARSWDRGYVDN
ncbi:MAG: hypothetical protein KTR32_19195 [Granulosicoccus sp.]|nr:hypothetical protein [Granulosicoccus sp.]